MFGRENRLPADLVLGDLSSEQPSVHLEDYAADLCERQQTDFILVREHLGQAARRRKERYDDSVRCCTFLPGQLVWYFYPRKRQGLSPKWQNFYTGPYYVLRLIDSHTVVIRRSKKSKCIVVHADKLKLCFIDERGETENQPDTLADAVPRMVQSLRVVLDNELDQPEEGSGSSSAELCVSDFIPTASTSEQGASYQSEENTVNKPKRTVKRPVHLTDYVVGCVFAENTAGRQLQLLQDKGTWCPGCRRGFPERHHLKRHLEARQDDMQHSSIARQLLSSWRQRGRFPGQETKRVARVEFLGRYNQDATDRDLYREERSGTVAKVFTITKEKQSCQEATNQRPVESRVGTLLTDGSRQPYRRLLDSWDASEQRNTLKGAASSHSLAVRKHRQANITATSEQDQEPLDVASLSQYEPVVDFTLNHVRQPSSTTCGDGSPLIRKR
jgi:hypothetical protein